MKNLIPSERIEKAILLIRSQKVILDSDLALIYGVPTKRLNEQVKRNRKRFPTDFMFQLTVEEKAEVVANCDHLTKLKFSPGLPNAFTEHGAVMLASVLNSEMAIKRDGTGPGSISEWCLAPFLCLYLFRFARYPPRLTRPDGWPSLAVKSPLHEPSWE